MKVRLNSLPIFVTCALSATAARAQTPLSTSFTFQGQLRQNNLPTDGTADFQFQLFPALAGGTQVGTTQAKNGVQIKNGLFSVELDFGSSAFIGDKRFLEIAVRSPAGSGSFTTLIPRQPISAAPYALFALSVPGGVGDGHSLDAADGSPTNAVFVDNAGDVGVGTTVPQAKLHVASGDILAGAPGAEWIFHTRSTFGGDFLHITDSDNGVPQFQRGLVITQAGNVGIGTTGPKQLLHVAGDYYGRGHLYLYAYEGDGASGTAYVQARDDSATSNIDLQLRSKAGNSVVNNIICKSNGRVGIGTTDPGELLHVNGTARVNVLEITGGADLSENFDVLGDAIKPGMVVVIDPQNPGRLQLATKPYDRTVAGVISGAGGVKTGMTMSQDGTIADGAHPVALSGRVYCWVDAAAASVRPGDFLTTSDTPGHAMKVGDLQQAQGAILGKAMTSLASGEKGLVLVLVNLQ